MGKSEKITTVVLIFVVIFGLTIIIWDSIPKELPRVVERFIEIERYSFSSLYYDIETKVIYYGRLGDSGNFLTPVYNPDGTLQIYPN